MDIESIPQKLKSAQRTAWLEQLKGVSSLDVDEIKLFEWYFNETESITQTMFAAENELLAEQILSEDDLNDSGMVAVAYFLRRVRYSHIIYLESLLESIMDHECDRLISAIGSHNAPFKAKDLKKPSWDAQKMILERYGGFTISKNLLQPIEQLIKVRNVLVHENGKLLTEKKAEISKFDGVNVTNGFEIEIEASYVKSVLVALRDLAGHLNQQVQEVINRAIRPKPIC